MKACFLSIYFYFMYHIISYESIAKTKEPIIVSVKGGVSYRETKIGKLFQPELRQNALIPPPGKPGDLPLVSTINNEVNDND